MRVELSQFQSDLKSGFARNEAINRLIKQILKLQEVF